MSSDGILPTDFDVDKVLNSTLASTSTVLLLKGSVSPTTVTPNLPKTVILQSNVIRSLDNPIDNLITGEVQKENLNSDIHQSQEVPENIVFSRLKSEPITSDRISTSELPKANPFNQYLNNLANFWDQTENQTKVLSLAILILLILPAVVMPNLNNHEQKVLGVTDSVIAREELDSLPVKKADTFNTGNPFENIKLPSVELPNISLPQYHLKPKLPQINLSEPVTNIVKTNTDAFLSMPKVELTSSGAIKQDTVAGKIRLDDSLSKNDVVSDKYEIGDKLKATYNGTTVDVVITGKRVLPLDTLIVIDRFKYAELTKDEKTVVVDGRVGK